MSRLVAAGVLLGAALAVPAGLSAQEVAWTGSLGGSTGDYIFTERTYGATLVNGLSVRSGRVSCSADLPLLYQSTPFVSVSGDAVIPSGGPEHPRVGREAGDGDGGGGGGSGPGHGSGMGAGSGGGSRSGLPSPSARRTVDLPDSETLAFDELGVGDPTFRLSVDVLPGSAEGPSLTLAGDVKAPVADVDRGFGTGEWDGGLSASVGQRLGATFVFADLGYRVLGDLPDLELQNPVSYGVSVGYAFEGGKTGLLASFSGYSEIVPDTDPPMEVGLGANYRISDRVGLSATGSAGLSESSPDVSLGVGWRVRLR